MTLHGHDECCDDEHCEYCGEADDYESPCDHCIVDHGGACYCEECCTSTDLDDESIWFGFVTLTPKPEYL